MTDRMPPLKKLHITTKITDRLWRCTCGHTENTEDKMDKHWRDTHSEYFKVE